MEPMFPKWKRGELDELSQEIFIKSGELRAALPAEAVRRELRGLVREMNSYYSNLIEGHKTLPRDIRRALEKKFSGGSDERRNQLMSAAHIRADEAMRRRLEEFPGTPVFGREFICWLHRIFYEDLPESEWFSETLDGEKVRIKPGEFRECNVDVGRHTPPDFPALPGFMRRFESVYRNELGGTASLIAIAASHHRLAWIHPFEDGNGRVARLQSQAALIRAGVDGSGLWTLSRGLARSRSLYYQKLARADEARSGDLDGRGNLSDQGLADFCHFFLIQVLDQITFMVGLLRPTDLVNRIEKYLRYERPDLTGRQTEQLSQLLKALCLEGEIQRGQVGKILNLKSSAAREVLSKAQKLGFVTSSTPKGPVRIAFPVETIEFYFPGLFADLAAE